MNDIAKSTIDRLNDLHRGIMGHMRSTVMDAVAAGEILTDLKERLPHGEFTPWIDEHCEFSLREAQRYMMAHRAERR